jgi:hypothetical protein
MILLTENYHLDGAEQIMLRIQHPSKKKCHGFTFLFLDTIISTAFNHLTFTVSFRLVAQRFNVR